MRTVPNFTTSGKMNHYIVKKYGKYTVFKKHVSFLQCFLKNYKADNDSLLHTVSKHVSD